MAKVFEPCRIGDHGHCTDAYVDDYGDSHKCACTECAHENPAQAQLNLAETVEAAQK